MNPVRYLILVLVIIAAALTIARADESLDALKHRAETAPLQDQPGLFAQIAERQLKAANDLYNAGKVDEARAAVDDIVTYSNKAAAAATKSGKKLKNVEIALRKIAEKLRDIQRTLAFEDQAPVQAAIDRLESLRTQLLTRMFEKKPK